MKRPCCRLEQTIAERSNSPFAFRSPGLVGQSDPCESCCCERMCSSSCSNSCEINISWSGNCFWKTIYLDSLLHMIRTKHSAVDMDESCLECIPGYLMKWKTWTCFSGIWYFLGCLVCLFFHVNYFFLQTLPSRLVDEDLMEVHSFSKVAVSGYSAYLGKFPRQKCQN